MSVKVFFDGVEVPAYYVTAQSIVLRVAPKDRPMVIEGLVKVVFGTGDMTPKERDDLRAFLIEKTAE